MSNRRSGVLLDVLGPRGRFGGRGAILLVAGILLALLGLEPSAHAEANGVIAYTKTVDEGLATERRAVFKQPGVQLTFPFGAIGKDSDSVPAWSPDGKRLAFARLMWRSSSEFERVIVVAEANGTERVIGTERYLDGSPTPLAQMSVRSMSWAPGGNEIAVEGACGGSSCARSLGVDGPGPNFWDDLNGLRPEGPGLDWGLNGIVHNCSGRNLPSPDLNLLFCVYRNEAQPDFPTAIDRTSGGDPDPTGGLVSAPSWMHDPRGDKVLFNYFALSPPENIHGIHAIKPSDPSEDPDTFLGREFELLVEGSSVSCSTSSGTTYQQRYNYGKIEASPDGKYILVARSRNVPRLSQDGSSCTFEQEDHGIFVLRKGGAIQNVVAMGKDVGEPAWQPSPANLQVVIDDGYDDDQDGDLDQLRGLKLELFTFETEQRVPIEATNPTGGEYQFEAVPSGDYRLRITLTDDDGGAFEVRHDYPDLVMSGVWAEYLVNVPDSEIVPVYRISLQSTEDGILRTSLDQASSRHRLSELAAIYWQLRRYVDWVETEVTTNTGGMVVFHAFATQDTDGSPWPRDMAAYDRARKIVLMGELKSIHGNRDSSWGAATGHTEWHEYTHHIDAANRAIGSSFGCLGTSHAGYANPTSCDSLVEGIASWLPAEFTGDPNYSGLGTNLETQIKAWDLRPYSTAALSAEEGALAALLWDLADSNPDAEDTLTVDAFRAHRAVRYVDSVDLDVRAVWELLGGVPIVDDVAGLQRKLDARAGFALTVDLDFDGSMDVNAYDPLFLMHGFFPIAFDQVVVPGHDTYHYEVRRARDAGLAANADVGLSSHRAFDFAGLQSPTIDPRSDVPRIESANLGLEIRDASGTPLAGAEVEVSLDFPGLPQVMKRRLDDGNGLLVPLELPLHFSHLPEDGQFPPCNPASDRYVTTTLTAKLNGYVSTTVPTFDNCAYADAIRTASGNSALSFAFAFPEDSTPPVTTAETFAGGQQFGPIASLWWAIDLHCADPEVGGFASGCRGIEYSLDGGPVRRFEQPFRVALPGSHRVEFRSLDAAANAEAHQSISFIVGLPPAPTVTGFTPSSGPTNTVVTITGTSFLHALDVQFNGLSASFTVDSDTQITALAPNGIGTAAISVIGPGGVGTSSGSFTFVPPPFVLGFTPTSGNAGTLVQISGQNFIGATRVAFNGVSASFGVVSSAQINAIVPVGATTGQISVTGPGGSFLSSQVFTVTGGGTPPVITSFSPASGSIGTSVTIKGDALTNAVSVSFNGVEAAFSFKRGSIVASVPANATTGLIRVRTPGGTATSASSFDVVPPPVLTGFSPTSGAVGSVVTVNGTNLSGTTSVKIGGSNAKFTIVSGAAISATVPKGAKSGPISVTTPGGTATSSGSFTVLK